MGINDLYGAGSSASGSSEIRGKVKTTSSDILEYLEDKLEAGSNISLEVQDDGDGTQSILISASTSGGSDTYKVKLDSSDGSPDFLLNKLSDGTGIDLSAAGEISLDASIGDLDNVDDSSLDDGYVLIGFSSSDTGFAELVLSLLGDVSDTLSLTTEYDLLAYNPTSEKMEKETLSVLEDVNHFTQSILIRGNDFAPEKKNDSPA